MECLENVSFILRTAPTLCLFVFGKCCLAFHGLDGLSAEPIFNPVVRTNGAFIHGFKLCVVAVRNLDALGINDQKQNGLMISQNEEKRDL